MSPGGCSVSRYNCIALSSITVIKVVVKRMLDDGCNANHKRFYVANWMCIISAAQNTPLIKSPAHTQESCIAIKRWSWGWISCAKDDPKFSWQGCLSLVLISCFTKRPFSLHSDIMESHITQLISFPVSSELRAFWTHQNSLRAHGFGESMWVLLHLALRLHLFLSSFPPTELRILLICPQLCDGKRHENKLAGHVK